MAPAAARRSRSLVLGATIAVVLAALNAPASAGEPLYPTDYVYLDVDGVPLPFQDDATILEALRTGTIVERKLMGRGVAGNFKLVISYRDLRMHAMLRVIDLTEREPTGSKRIVVKYRDSFIFEVAAYQLDRLLGIGRVPPTVERRFGDQRGSVQIWMEGTTPEDVLVEENRLDPPDLGRWRRQKAIMRVFDALIANIDRNQGNLLVDDDWNIWYIDHTRAFRETAKLIDLEHLDTCERRLLRAIRSADLDAVEAALAPYLTSKELSKLELRWGKLLKHFDKRIRKLGEDEVLFDLAPSRPAPEG